MQRKEVKEMLKIRNEKHYELQPKDSHKSFYNKAIVHVSSKDGSVMLQSYSTIVAVRTRDGVIHRLWDGYSATTMRHLAAFGFQGGKAAWSKMPVENLLKYL